MCVLGYECEAVTCDRLSNYENRHWGYYGNQQEFTLEQCADLCNEDINCLSFEYTGHDCIWYSPGKCDKGGDYPASPEITCWKTGKTFNQITSNCV